MKYLTGVLICIGALWGNPSGSQVIHGDVAVSCEGNTLQIHTGDRAIIHWKDFSIEKGELTKFVQASSKSAVLNKVKGGNASHILGQLESNGTVYLINPHGVIIGQDAVVNTGGFLASTFDVMDTDFLQGRELLFEGTSQESVVNLGTIQAWDGDVTLIGYRVKSEGKVEAPHGVTSFAAGTSILFKPEGSERVFIRAASGEKEGTGIEHRGIIQAADAELKAAGNIYQFAIMDDGVIEATGTVEKEGRVLLVAEGSGWPRILQPHWHRSLNMSAMFGKIKATGGTVHLLGESIGLHGSIDVSGETGGGTVLVGGDYQGLNPEIMNAQAVYFAPYSSIQANALEEGNGGKVILWSDRATHAFGKVWAEGGPRGGDGGFVEISGGILSYEGNVSTRAPLGKTGTFLLDPIDMNITPGGAGIANATGFPTVTATTQPGSVGATTVGGALGGSNVLISSSAAAGAGTGRLTLQTGAVITWASGNTLTLLAPLGAEDVRIHGQVQATGAGDVILSSLSGNVIVGPDTASGPGDAFVQTNTGDITAGAVLDVQVLGGINVVGKAALTSTSGSVTVNADQDVILTGGNQADTTSAIALGNYAAIRAETLAANVISVNAGRDVLITGGQAGGGSGFPADWGSYAQIGHWGGGDNIDPLPVPVTLNVPINVTAARDVILNGGPGDLSGGGVAADSCYAAIGHGGANNGVGGAQTYLGDITVNAGRNVSVIGSTPNSNVSYDYAQIGHHGGTSTGAITIGSGPVLSNTTVNALNGTVRVQGGGGGAFTSQYCFGLIGPGGEGWSANWFANVDVNCDDFQIVGGGANATSHNCWAHIGFAAADEIGGFFLTWASNNVTVISTNGVVATNTITGGTSSGLSGAGQYSSPAGIGYMVNGTPPFAFGNLQNTTVRCGGNLVVTGGTNGFNPAGITLDYTPSAQLFGACPFTVDVGGNLTATATATSPVEFTNFRNFGGQPYTFTVGGSATFTGGTAGGINTIVNSGGAFTMDVGTDLQMLAPSAGVCDFDAQGVTDIDAGRDFVSQGPASANTFNVLGGGWTVDAGRNILIDHQSNFTHQPPGGGAADWIMTAGSDFTVQNGSTLTQLFSGITPELSLFAGRNMALVNNVTINKQSGGELNLVCDNNFPTFPGIGPGGITIDGTTTVNNANFLQPLRIYTARRSQNNISGFLNLNGGTFLPGAFLVNTSQEVWCAYYPRTEFVQLFVIFYKECDLVQGIENSSAFIVSGEALEHLHPYDEYLGWPLYFDFSYQGIERSPIPYFIRAEKRLEHNPKEKEVETFDDIFEVL